MILFSPPHGVYQGWSQYNLSKYSRYWKWKDGRATTRVSEESLGLYNPFETDWRIVSSYSIILHHHVIFDSEVEGHNVLLTPKWWFMASTQIWILTQYSWLGGWHCLLTSVNIIFLSAYIGYIRGISTAKVLNSSSIYVTVEEECCLSSYWCLLVLG